jgi:hypothetical protein
MRDPAGTIALNRAWYQVLNIPLVRFYPRAVFSHSIFSFAECCDSNIRPSLLLLPAVRIVPIIIIYLPTTTFRWGLSRKWWVVAPPLTLMLLSIIAAIITVRPGSSSQGCAHNTFLFRQPFSGRLVLPQIGVRPGLRLVEPCIDISPQSPSMCQAHSVSR